MNIYVACHDQSLARSVSDALTAAGHVVVSTWVYAKQFLPTAKHTERECRAIAGEDFDDIRASDALVLVAGPEKYSGGKFVEAGIAMGLGKPVVVIGRRENMLMWCPAVHAVDTPEEAANFLVSVRKDVRKALARHATP